MTEQTTLPREDQAVPVAPMAPGIYDVLRDTDQTGVSGTGLVAQLAVFEDGSAVTRWLTETGSTVVWNTWRDAYHVHISAHPDTTRLEMRTAWRKREAAPESV